MNADIDTIQKANDLLVDNGNDYLGDACIRLNKALSIASGINSSSIGDYNNNISVYISYINNLLDDLKSLDLKEEELVTNANALIKRIAGLNGEYSSEYNANFVNSNGSPLPLNEARIKLLTYRMANGDFGLTKEEQMDYFLNNFGYNSDVYNLIRANLDLQSRSFFYHPDEVTINVPVPVLLDDGKIKSFFTFDGNVYNKDIVNLLLLNNDFFSSADDNGSTYKSVETGDNVIYIYNYLVNNFGYTDTGAKAILANMMVESFVKPTTENREGAFGLCQWLGDRRNQLEKYASENHLNVNNIDTQLEFMNHELSTRWNDARGLYASLIGEKETDFTTLTKDFCAMYEIPSNDFDASIRAGLNRAKYESADAVKQIIDEYKNFQPNVELLNQYYSNVSNS